MSAPAVWTVVDRVRERGDVVSLELGPRAGGWRPGQFAMLTAFGYGEVPISVSAIGPESITATVAAVGPVTTALCALAVGAPVGVRGPFGTAWSIDVARGGDVVVVAGGLGLAPLRPVVRSLEGAARMSVLAGARAPRQLLFGDELHWWAAGAHVRRCVDVADGEWDGPVGLVTDLIAGAPFDPERTRAFVCGPEPMMRAAAAALVALGVAPGRVEVSLERNMQCGSGLCGHCQLGPVLVCRDGPIVRWDRARPLLEVANL